MNHFVSLLNAKLYKRLYLYTIVKQCLFLHACSMMQIQLS